jgi:hypothetical protein
MNLDNMLTELREESRRIDDAIIALEKLALAGAKRRGRPPKWMSKPSGSSLGPASKSPQTK